MAQVPRAPLNRVQTSAAANVFQSTNIPEGAFGDRGAGLKSAGQGIAKAGEQLFQIGLDNQKEDEDRDVQQRVLNYRKDLLEQQNGKDGWAHLTGQTALDRSEEYKVRSQQSLAKHSKGANQRVLDKFNAAAGKAAFSASSSRGSHLVRQRKTAADITDTATSKMANEEILNDPFGPNVSRNIIEIIDSQTRIAERAGITQANNPAAYELIVKGAVTQAHSSVIKNLEETGRIQEAQEYFKKYGSSMTAAARGESKSLLIDGLIGQAVDQSLDAIRVAPVPEGKNAATFRLDKARSHPDTKVREELVKRTRLYNMEQRRAKNDNDKQHMKDIISASNTGQPLTTAQKRIVQETKGLSKLVAELQESTASGQPRVSNKTFQGELSTMRSKDEPAFLAIDLDDPENMRKLTFEDRQMWKETQRLVSGKNRKTARQKKADRIQDEKANRRASSLNTATKAAKGEIARAIDSGSLTVENRSDFDRRLTDELERRVANGEKLSQKNYQDVVRSLLRLQVSNDATFFGTTETPLFDPAGDIRKSSLEDYASENKDHLASMSAETGIDFNTTSRMSKHLAERGIVPTPTTITRLFRDSVAKQAEAAAKIPGNLSDDEKSKADPQDTAKKALTSKATIKLSTKAARNNKTAAEAYKSASTEEKAIFDDITKRFEKLSITGKPPKARDIQAEVARRFKASSPERKKLAGERAAGALKFLNGIWKGYQKSSKAHKKALDAALKSRRKGAVAKAKADQKRDDQELAALYAAFGGKNITKKGDDLVNKKKIVRK